MKQPVIVIRYMLTQSAGHCTKVCTISVIPNPQSKEKRRCLDLVHKCSNYRKHYFKFKYEFDCCINCITKEGVNNSVQGNPSKYQISRYDLKIRIETFILHL